MVEIGEMQSFLETNLGHPFEAEPSNDDERIHLETERCLSTLEYTMSLMFRGGRAHSIMITERNSLSQHVISDESLLRIFAEAKFEVDENKFIFRVPESIGKSSDLYHLTRQVFALFKELAEPCLEAEESKQSQAICINMSENQFCLRYGSIPEPFYRNKILILENEDSYDVQCFCFSEKREGMGNMERSVCFRLARRIPKTANFKDELQNFQLEFFHKIEAAVSKYGNDGLPKTHLENAFSRSVIGDYDTCTPYMGQ